MPHRLFDRMWKRILWLVAVALLAYLPRAVQLTYYRDDWYYAYDALVGPAGVFRYMFASDRPARGPFFELYQMLFGMAPGPYHLAMLGWRIAGGLALVWLFNLLWPRRAAAGLAAGILFAIYPGFTWWVQAIEYQPMVASAALMVVSLALTVKAVQMAPSMARTLCIAGAIVTGWIYLALVEYAAGIEVLRLGLVYAAIHSGGRKAPCEALRTTLRKWLPYGLIPAGFVLWRFLVFSSERRATDLSAQVGSLISDPFSTGLRWTMSFLVSVINVVWGSWILPLLESYFAAGLRDQVLGLALAAAAGVLAFLLLRSAGDGPAGNHRQPRDGWPGQALWLGIAGLLLGIVPIVVANRQVALPSFSHYSLPASLGLVLLLAGIVSLLPARWMQAFVFSGLIAISVLTHQGLGADALREERTIAAFWQQVAWRAPSIAPGTTLLVSYPGVDYGTDSDVVWGPANHIYYPGAQTALPVILPLAAITQDRDSFNAALVGRDVRESTYRAHSMTVDYGSVLIVAQSATDACVRVIDPRWPMISTRDDPALHALASSSRVAAVQTSDRSVVLHPQLFGQEPVHGWCYYFERASLAAQQGQWQQVAALQDEFAERDLHANDQIEWMPFLLARAALGDLDELKGLATRINTEKLYRLQACRNLQAMPDHGYPLPAASDAYVDELFCGGSP